MKLQQLAPRISVRGNVFPGEIAGASLKHGYPLSMERRRDSVFPGEIAGASLKPALLTRILQPLHAAFSPAKSPGPH